MKNNIKLSLILICLQLVTKIVSSEPFVVLEYKGNNSHDNSSKINKNNKFIKDKPLFNKESL